MIALVGRLGGQQTALSQVKVCDLNTKKVMWIGERELISLLAKGSVSNMDLSDGTLLPVYEGTGDRKVLAKQYKDKEVAVAIIQDNNKKLYGWMIYGTKIGVRVIKRGEALSKFKNVINLGVSDIYNRGVADNTSIIYRNTLAIINKK